ncbi:MAG: enoyl-CoA hydratase/isomerase family protein [Actinobacteria bacterium]|nr:enoyl-CoA hydratase/isomerase family protein [Actinomycetota bacterium]
MSSMLRYKKEDSVAWLTLDRPEQLNAMTRDFWPELVAGLQKADADDEVRAVILNGNGRAFCTGGDIVGFGELGDAGDRRAYLREAFGAMRMLESFRKPTIAAVHGYCVAGGCELTMMCDLVIADETLKIGVAEIAVGLTPGPGLGRGSSHANLHWMKYMVMTGDTLDAEEARIAGLVNKVTPAGDHLAVAEKLARKLAGQAPLALEVGKKALNRQYEEHFDHAMDAVSFLQSTEDFREGIAAFAEKRDRRFEGR